MKTYEDYIKEDSFYKKYEIDGQRHVPIDTLIIHHSDGPSMQGVGDVEIVDVMSEFHKHRFYKDGSINPHHTHRFRDMPVYCAYHFLGRYMPLYNEWRFTPTMYGIEKNVAGGTSMFIVNQKSIQVCILGDYTDNVPEYDFVEDFVSFFEPFAERVKNNGIDLEIFGHKNFDDTSCPGRIMELIPDIRDGLTA